MAGSDDLRRLELDLGKAAARVVPEVEKVLKRGAQDIKTGMQAAFNGSSHFRGAGRTVSYDRKGGFGSIGYEIGPTIGGAGSLAGVAVEGGANGGGGNVDIDTPSQAAAVVTEEFIAKALDGLL